MADQPVLWHIEVSHYNEKARWALDFKQVPHERRAPPPGVHMAYAMWLTRGEVKTFPVLELGGERIGDSTRIIEALERRYPEPPLNPEDPSDREQALELEDFFDEEVAPHVRLLLFHEAVKDREVFDEFAGRMLPPAIRERGQRVMGAYAATFLSRRYGVHDPEAAELAKRKIEAGFDRLEAELGKDQYLVGDAFTVADLTAASIFYPLVRPPEGPQVALRYPEAIERYRLSISDRPGYQWVLEMYRRNRGTSAASRSSGLAAVRA